MTKERKSEIKQLALALYSKHFQRGSPASKMTQIILKEKLWYSEIVGCKDFLGALVKVNNDPLHIMVNIALNDKKMVGRKNFTIAHELGHYALSHHLSGTSFFCKDGDVTEDGVGGNDQEIEANHFAACFLLPSDQLISQFNKWYKSKVYHGKLQDKANPSLHIKNARCTIWCQCAGVLKKHFAVSTATLKIRLVELDLINDFPLNQ